MRFLRGLVALAGAVVVTLAATSAWAEGTSFRVRFDQADAALNQGAGYKDATNENGLLGWGESYVLMSYAAMFRQSLDPGYLIKLADHGLSVLASTDAARGINDFAGRSRACWLATKYSGPGNEPACWCVHTGMIAAPLAELGALVAAHPHLAGLAVPGKGTLGQVATTLVAGAEAAVAVHDGQYQAGPASGEGHYRGDPQASFFAYAGKELPKNWSTAMGRAYLALYQATGKVAHRQRAEAIARYLRARLSKRGSGWTWTYGGSDPWSQGKGEDISHAAISVDFAARAQAAKLVFGASDLRRFGRTVAEVVHVDSATTADRVDGGGKTNTYSRQLGRWLAVAPFEPRVWPIVASLFEGVTSGGGSTLMGLANLARFAPPLRHYDFYKVDWQDLGKARKATAYGANILASPPTPSQVMAMRLGYRAQRRATVQQWDGSAYHDLMVLAAKASGPLGWVYVPYDPAIHHAYSGKQVLFQFADAFVSQQGIEVAEVPPASMPTIATKTLPAGREAEPYQLTLVGSGEVPLRWALTAGPAGLLLDATSGELRWKSPTAGAHPVGLRLENDAGHVAMSVTLSVAPALADGASRDAGVRDGAAADGGQASEDAAAARDKGTKDSEGGTTTEGSGGCALAAKAATWRSWWVLGTLLVCLGVRRHRRRRRRS